MTPDVNVLIAAFRRDHPQHGAARTRLDQARALCAKGSTSLLLLSVVVADHAARNQPARVHRSGIEDAVAFVDVLLSSPGVEVQAGAAEWPLLREKLVTGRLQGNYVTDAWIAAATEALAEHLVTFDRDFQRLLHSRDLTVLES